MNKSIEELMKEFNEKMSDKKSCSCCGECDKPSETSNQGNNFFESVLPLMFLFSMLPRQNSDSYDKGRADAYKEILDKVLNGDEE